ncbi:zinc-dependent alcohol dehydrogenase family protein [Acidicapsa acidisoli]|uniref:zinc-dependent alcohol dehydrogenase family protein n=1 Tax=Acidicapsa acidisoli TaxID=1615681 RepID=UPI0021E08649|nr:NAD(P)-dependent alcohol dehydrogenase [Acidicapsa acidisoli]
MQQWQIPAFGIDSLVLSEKPSSQPGPGQVLVRVHAISLNYRDLMVVKGLYNPRLAMPRVPCSDGAGEVVAVGAGVTQWKAGDRVAGIFMQNWQDGRHTAAKAKGALGGDIDGMLTTEVALAESGLVRIPDHLSYQEGATLPCAAVTAWSALFKATDTQPGDTVLIQGTGGVSIFALQFAKMAGARVLGISSSDEKLERAKTLGLDAGLNYRTNPDWEKWALEQTGGTGVDLVVEVGGSGTLPRAIRAVRPEGTVAQIGVLSGVAEAVDVRPILSRQIRIQGVYVGSRADFVAMNKAVAQAGLKPAVDSVFAFAEAPAALRRMEGAGHFGKIVISAE